MIIATLVDFECETLQIRSVTNSQLLNDWQQNKITLYTNKVYILLQHVSQALNLQDLPITRVYDQTAIEKFKYSGICMNTFAIAIQQNATNSFDILCNTSGLEATILDSCIGLQLEVSS